MNILFLDYDGVVNTPMWQLRNNQNICCYYNCPSDDSVNNFQACQWVSEFCEKFDYKIVVTSTWRLHSNYKACLRNGGLRDTVEIIGKTSYLNHDHSCREDEIQTWLNEHPDVENFLIVDDDLIEGFDDHYVPCKQDCGFNLKEYTLAERLH